MSYKSDTNNTWYVHTKGYFEKDAEDSWFENIFMMCISLEAAGNKQLGQYDPFKNKKQNMICVTSLKNLWSSLRAVPSLEGLKLEFSFITHISSPSSIERVQVHNSCLKFDVCLCSPESPRTGSSHSSTLSHAFWTLPPSSLVCSMPRPAWCTPSRSHPPPGHQLRDLPPRSEDNLHHLCHPLTVNVQCLVSLPTHRLAWGWASVHSSVRWGQCYLPCGDFQKLWQHLTSCQDHGHLERVFVPYLLSPLGQYPRLKSQESNQPTHRAKAMYEVLWTGRSQDLEKVLHHSRGSGTMSHTHGSSQTRRDLRGDVVHPPRTWQPAFQSWSHHRESDSLACDAVSSPTNANEKGTPHTGLPSWRCDQTPPLKTKSSCNTTTQLQKWLKPKKTKNTKGWQDCETNRTFIPCWWEGKMVQPFRKIVWHFLIKVNMCLAHNPAIPFLSIYPTGLYTSK